jgi:transposase
MSCQNRPSNLGCTSHAGDQSLTTFKLGALPILNRFIERANIESSLRQLMVEDKRCTIKPVVGTLVLLKNYLASREPIYGVSEWARHYVPGLLELSTSQLSSLNDDRVGRCLDQLFKADCPSLVLTLTRHVVEEFGIDLTELHNDSTTITFFGDYNAAETETRVKGKIAPAITWGFNKDHRGDLKQLLYNLTVSADGAVPVSFGVANGNVTDDQTHIANWEFQCKVVGSPDFIYVADSKLATHANMTYIAQRGGRFISVLPRSRTEDRDFRRNLVMGGVHWEEIHKEYNEVGELVDIVSVAKDPVSTSEGFRLPWFLSTQKIVLDRAERAKKIRQAFGKLSELRQKLRSPRTRYCEESQVASAIENRLEECGATEWITVNILPEEREVFTQETPGRPGPHTRYRKEVRQRFDIAYEINHAKVEEAEKQDGIFPLVTNDRNLPPVEVLTIYKRQAQVEKRFSQLKSQFDVAPVFLKSVHRVVALLTIYYLALLVQSLVERELRLAMEKERIPSLPLYPENRKCKAPTTRRIIDLFENIQLHELQSPSSQSPQRFVTTLSELQRVVLRLLNVPESDYNA